MWLRTHLSYANVTATLALFVALGGTSYAVVRVGSYDVIDNTLRSRDIRNDSLRSKDIRNQTLRGRDVRQNALGEREIREGSLARVPAALDAERLGGRTADQLRVRCPTDTQPVAGACIETTARAATDFFGAASTCDVAGRGLPTLAELIRLPGSLSPEGEWTSSVYLETAGANTSERLHALLVAGFGTVDHAPVNAPGSYPFRCVALPSN